MCKNGGIFHECIALVIADMRSQIGCVHGLYIFPFRGEKKNSLRQKRIEEDGQEKNGAAAAAVILYAIVWMSMCIGLQSVHITGLLA